ncbi:TPA: lytic transglycosylase domain-containing protein [Burkholderia lata]
MKKLLLLICFSVITGSAFAQDACFAQAAQRYQVDERLLRAIVMTENAQFDPRLVIRSKEGWEYIGLGMISSIWLPVLEKYGITRESLMDPCVNVNVEGWILRDAENRYGKTWKAVGAYNTGKYSADDDAQRRYVRKVWKNYYLEALR